MFFLVFFSIYEIGYLGYFLSNMKNRSSSKKSEPAPTYGAFEAWAEGLVWSSELESQAAESESNRGKEYREEQLDLFIKK